MIDHFIYRAIGLEQYDKAIHLLLEERNRYSEDSTDYFYYCWWISDCYAMMGKYFEALHAYPKIPIGSRNSALIDKLLSLKVTANEDYYSIVSNKSYCPDAEITNTSPVCLTSHDVLSLLGPKTTQFGKEFLDKIASCISALLEAYGQMNLVELLSKWTKECYSYKYQVFIGTSLGYEATQKITIMAYSFSRSHTVASYIRSLTRQAENIVREEQGLPNVGEGWVSEARLYHEIKDALNNLEVVHHFSPHWLGRQHLDIFIPSMNIALEYQGKQHDEPVKFFGGEDAYKKTKQRDARKSRLCKKNGIKLIYVRPGYSLQDVLTLIFER